MLFAVATVTFAVRAYIRARILKQFSAEDVLILLAVICLIGVTCMTYISLPEWYGKNLVKFNGFNAMSKDFKENRIEASLWSLIIYLVKMAYLVFFCRLVGHLRAFKFWLWCIVAFTLPAGIVSLAMPWLLCPHFTLERPFSRWFIPQFRTSLIIAFGQRTFRLSTLIKLGPTVLFSRDGRCYRLSRDIISSCASFGEFGSAFVKRLVLVFLFACPLS